MPNQNLSMHWTHGRYAKINYIHRIESVLKWTDAESKHLNESGTKLSSGHIVAVAYLSLLTFANHFVLGSNHL